MTNSFSCFPKAIDDEQPQNTTSRFGSKTKPKQAPNNKGQAKKRAGGTSLPPRTSPSKFAREVKTSALHAVQEMARIKARMKELATPPDLVTKDEYGSTPPDLATKEECGSTPQTLTTQEEYVSETDEGCISSDL